MKHDKKGLGGLVYSTDPDFKIEPEALDLSESLKPNQQDLRIELNRKLKAGKVATVITGFQGPPTSLEDLGKKIKTYCGTGGSIKEGLIIIQGDFRDKILIWLQKEGYKAKKAGG
jgi:translation initiation factor 1